LRWASGDVGFSVTAPRSASRLGEVTESEWRAHRHYAGRRKVLAQRENAAGSSRTRPRNGHRIGRPSRIAESCAVGGLANCVAVFSRPGNKCTDTVLRDEFRSSAKIDAASSSSSALPAVHCIVGRQVGATSRINSVNSPFLHHMTRSHKMSRASYA